MEAISVADKKASINQEMCVECGTCIRPRVVRCPTKAIYEPYEQIKGTPREVRRFFSDPATTHGVTGVPGRGTEEVKTNDVTGRVCRGEIGIAIELGRPCVGTTFAEVEKVTMALAKHHVDYEECNPLTHLMADRIKGTFKEEYKQENVLSAIVEFNGKLEQMAELLETIKETAKELDTVFSLDLICCFEEDGSIPVLTELERIGMKPRANAKVNLGMGRPYKIIREA
ncbi:4Fe-4S binding domain protein [Desulfitobacterium hafniense DP7]|uniref:4Fe-4S binding domain protein n=2 Tax=Desulfitobacterium hafniense TaxID=49338 RepID=G9XQS9_DESHA|nr:4Fe-4S binding domain protein [Desulfitobacterium hafniense DP7]